MWLGLGCRFFFFFFNDPAPTEIYPLSLHDALPISRKPPIIHSAGLPRWVLTWPAMGPATSCQIGRRSEEHTSELQSQSNLVCRLLLEKKKYRQNVYPVTVVLNNLQ